MTKTHTQSDELKLGKVIIRLSWIKRKCRHSEKLVYKHKLKFEKENQRTRYLN